MARLGRSDEDRSTDGEPRRGLLRCSILDMSSTRQAYDALCCYTLSLGDEEFLHQHVVDAFAAQDASEDDKPIRLTFALVGLYLHVEHGFTGREVQRAHMKLAATKRDWPRFAAPAERGAITAADVLAVPDGKARDRRIQDWCVAVWRAYSSHREDVRALLRDTGVHVPPSPG